MYAFVVVALFLSQASPGVEAAEPFPYSAELQPLYDKAFELAHGESKPGAAAVEAVQELVDKAPDNPRTHRLAGQLYLRQNRFKEAEKALGKALKLGIDGERRADVLSSQGFAYLQLNRKSEAELALRKALKENPKDPTGLFLSAMLDLQSGEFTRARAYAKRLVESTPGSGAGHAVLAAAHFNLGNTAEAEEAMQRARELGAPESMLKDIEEDMAHDELFGLAWKVPVGMVLFLGLGLLGSWVAGRVLSSVQLGQLSADHSHLLREDQTPSERRVDRLYSAVLWFASVLFYVAVPMLLMLTLALTGGLVYGMLQARAIPIKLLLIVIIGGGGVLIAILRGLFTSPEQPDEGRVLKEKEAPQLFKALAEVAEVAKSRRVDRVVLEAGAGIGVREAGGKLAVLMGRGERILHLGLGALRGLTVSELKSILAHEYGHFSHGETRLTPIISRIQTQVLQTLHGIQEVGWAMVNPVWWYLRAYFFVYLQITAGHGRRRELLADRVSALAYGGDTFARALTSAVENGDLFNRGLGVAAGLREAGRPSKDLYRTIEAAARGTPSALRALIRDELFARPVDAYDSHPPPSERVERVRGIPGQRPVEDDSAMTLFADPEKLTAELGGEVLTRLDTALEMQGHAAGTPVDTTDEARDQLAEAVARHYGALMLGERNHPEAYALLQQSVADLEQTAGAEDPFLVPALQELSKVHVQHQNPAAARVALQRAIGIVESQPVLEPQRVDALNELLKGLPAQQAA